MSVSTWRAGFHLGEIKQEHLECFYRILLKTFSSHSLVPVCCLWCEQVWDFGTEVFLVVLQTTISEVCPSLILVMYHKSKLKLHSSLLLHTNDLQTNQLGESKYWKWIWLLQRCTRRPWINFEMQMSMCWWCFSFRRFLKIQQNFRRNSSFSSPISTMCLCEKRKHPLSISFHPFFHAALPPNLPNVYPSGTLPTLQRPFPTACLFPSFHSSFFLSPFFLFEHINSEVFFLFAVGKINDWQAKFCHHWGPKAYLKYLLWACLQIIYLNKTMFCLQSKIPEFIRDHNLKRSMQFAALWRKKDKSWNSISPSFFCHSSL